ncbi:MAG TPA: SPFH domain-containing protein [Candidatus Eisenbacteria bacterium]|nr:SPFH domain-containing protein [Candidatus Eisenbacteria bacterium]
MIQEKEVRSVSGPFMLLALPVLIVLDVVWLARSVIFGHVGVLALALPLLIVLVVSLAGLFTVDPNVGVVVTLFGRYAGSERRPGLWWTNPLTFRRRVSLRVRNFESGKLKVNDHDGNPIEIAAVVVWNVVDTAEAMFQVDNYDDFVHVQSEAALRNLATGHPYDAHQDGQMSLRGNTTEVAELLKQEVQARLQKAGVEVVEARISHLAYAPEIANAMLRRQQASAVIAARTMIVEGAVSMVQMALDELSKRAVIQLDEERKATMVSNLLVVLCSEHETQPIVNAGTLYQ